MAGQKDVMSVAEASERLGVSVRQVQRLAANGVLTEVGTVGRTKLIDAGSVQRLKSRGARPGRPWTAGAIAAALDFMENGETSRLTSVERGRLRARLAQMSAEDLVRATRTRAVVRRYRASATFLDRVREKIRLTGLAAIDSDSSLAQEFGLAQGTHTGVDGYVDEKLARQLIRDHHLVEDQQGTVTLRITEIDSLRAGGAVAVALDLAESLDPRARSAGLAYLRRRLKTLR